MSLRTAAEMKRRSWKMLRLLCARNMEASNTSLKWIAARLAFHLLLGSNMTETLTLILKRKIPFIVLSKNLS